MTTPSAESMSEAADIAAEIGVAGMFGRMPEELHGIHQHIAAALDRAKEKAWKECGAIMEGCCGCSIPENPYTQSAPPDKEKAE